MNFLDSRGNPRIVVTGVGAVTPLALTADESWQAAVAGESGIAGISQFDASDLPCRIAGEVKGFSARNYMNVKDARRMSRASQMTVAAAQMGLEDAGIQLPFAEPESVGVVIGTGMGGLERAYDNYDVYRAKGLGRVNPFSLTSALPNMPSHHVSLMAGTHGPFSTVVAACATGTQAVGEGADLIRHGRADMVLAGGVEGLIHPAAMAGFAAMRALSLGSNDAPARAMRPFDKDRDGFILSEGAGILVLERLDHAVARSAGIYAEYLGYASSSDAFHVAQPDPNGAGAVRAMRWAIKDAGIQPDEIDYINAHGSSTPINDATETHAIKTLFGEHAYNLAVSSTKSVMGHAMGGTGAIEAIFCAYALRDSIIPPTCNYETPDPNCDLDYVPNEARPVEIKTALSNSFGLGGQNACLVLGKYQPNGIITNGK